MDAFCGIRKTRKLYYGQHIQYYLPFIPDTYIIMGVNLEGFLLDASTGVTKKLVPLKYFLVCSNYLYLAYSRSRLVHFKMSIGSTKGDIRSIRFTAGDLQVTYTFNVLPCRYMDIKVSSVAISGYT